MPAVGSSSNSSRGFSASAIMISVARWSPWLELADQSVGLFRQAAHVEKIDDPRADLASASRESHGRRR